jgi:hypothetical protein
MSESEAYAKVMGAVEKVQPQRVEEFQGWCQYFGSAPNEEAEVKAKEFYEYLSTAFGPAFAAGLAPDLAQLIPDEMKKTVLLKCAGIDYVSPTTVAQATSAPAPSADSIADPMAFLATTQDEDVKLTPEEEAALKEREEAKAKAEADQLTALQHESVEGLAGSELAAAEARNAEKDVVKDLQQGKTSMWDMTKMGENRTKMKITCALLIVCSEIVRQCLICSLFSSFQARPCRGRNCEGSDQRKDSGNAPSR